jgi:hypothetical protein
MDSQRLNLAPAREADLSDMNANGAKQRDKGNSPDSSLASPKLAASSADDIPLTRGNISFLQRAIGNGATRQFIHRRLAPVVQRQGGNLDQLNGMLNSIDVPEEDVIALCKALTAAEKATVLAGGYKDRMASALNVGEMVQAVEALGPPLSTKLEWVRASSLTTSSIDYPDIAGMVRSAPQVERDALKSDTWKSFFVDVCDNTTMVTALDDFHFDLATKLTWLRAEMTVTSWELDYPAIQAWITAASQTERDALKTDAWKGFFVDVCTNATMVTALNDLNFDLETKLTWLNAEMTVTRWELDYPAIKPWITAAQQSERDALKTDPWKAFFVVVCTNATMEEAVGDLNHDLDTQVRWMVAESDAATVLATTSFITKLRAAPNFADLMKILGVNDVFIYDLRLKLQASNKQGFFDDVSGLAGARAGDALVRDAFSDFVKDGLITWAEAFRASALLDLGPRHTWPQLIQNYDDGLAAGAFTIGALPPAGAEALRQFCMVQAGQAAEGTGVMSSYRNQFNSLWDAPPHNALPSDFDPSLDSKGPRNRRARSIFTALYADATIKTAYDTNTPPGFRDMCDTLAGPEGINLIASPRLQNLRALLNPPVVTASGTTDPPYVVLVAAIRPVAETLDAPDRQQLRQTHSWRLAVDAKVSGPTPPVTQTLRDDLWNIVETSRPAVPVAPTPVTPAPPEAPPPLDAAKRAWLAGITLKAPTSPVPAQAAEQSLLFDIKSGVPNPGVPVRRHVVVEPAAQVMSGQDDQTAWPPGSASVPHTASVDPDSGAAPSTVFTTRLNMPPVTSADFPEKTATVTVEDKRQTWFVANIGIGATYMLENKTTTLTPGSTVNYYGGQLALIVRPGLPAPNPGLQIEMEGEIKRSGVVLQTFARRPFGRTADSDQLGSFNVQEPPGVPPPLEPMEINVSFFPSAGPAIKTLNLAFNVAPSLPVAAGTDASILAADKVTLNQPPAVAGSLLNYMTTAFPPDSSHYRVANGVATGAIQLEAVIVRSDSAAWLAAHGGNPATQVAYACGNMSDARALKAAPGAVGWRVPAFPNFVFLNLTPQINAPAVKRSNAELANLLAHEGIHSADLTEPGDFGRYATEFRAYWIGGRGAGMSTAFDATMTGKGPKTPRARTIFEFLYNHPLYSEFTRPNYDANVNQFRERVDNMLVPDGINLALSGNLQALRTEVESYTGAAGTFAAKRAAIATRYAACNADDRVEITGNRTWRDLVERKFTVAAEMVQIKTDLAIPR